MTENRGRKSAAELQVVRIGTGGGRRPPPPPTIGEAAAKLWREIVQGLPSDFFGAGDLPLLAEYCHTMETLLPAINGAIERDGPTAGFLSARATLLKTGMALAAKLRICVSARTRGDLASLRQAAAPHAGSIVGEVLDDE